MKIKIFKIVAFVILVYIAFNIVGVFFLELSIFAKSFKSKSYERDMDYEFKKDTSHIYKQKIDIYTFKLDSLLEINPLQTELFADKLHKKYKKETIFLEYKAIALYNQQKFHKALQLYKIIDTPYSQYLGTKMNNNRNIALCFENLKMFDSAIYYYKVSSLSDNLYKIGSCFNSKKEKDSAVFYYSKLLNTLERSENKIYYIKDIDYLKFKIDSIIK
ncbi:hypothetical protein FIA58_014245 [Flavobacterium jejuense]|uniref:Tetratricopeptide repeat-like domain-containing protein n=1 Tax=Flavobacterium jejuense TaxID=1544455 RepID=A0ABX0ISK0_9FLAO|nr:tetratricopeptide repeat protein [Flavobacterium jejuense]NHN26842.1 hypothetical protein [Flavobacterium jejuense]